MSCRAWSPGRQVEPADADRAGRGEEQAAEHLDGGRLPGPVRPEEGEQLARPATSASRSSTAGLVPYRLVTFVNSITGRSPAVPSIPDERDRLPPARPPPGATPCRPRRPPTSAPSRRPPGRRSPSTCAAGRGSWSVLPVAGLTRASSSGGGRRSGQRGFSPRSARCARTCRTAKRISPTGSMFDVRHVWPGRRGGYFCEREVGRETLPRRRAGSARAAGTSSRPRDRSSQVPTNRRRST